MRTKHLSVLIHISNKVGLVRLYMLKPYSSFLTDHSNAVLLLWIIFVICVSCHTTLSVPCSLVVTCREMALLYVTFSCVFLTFHMDVLGQVWYLIVWIPDLCFLPYFY